MYTVLKTKRFRFVIPEENIPTQEDLIQKQSFQVTRESSDMIVGSCFLDDQLVLFLFNSGRYLIVDTLINGNPQKAQEIKENTSEPEIVYHGHILHEVQDSECKSFTQNLQNKPLNTNQKRLLPKNSLNFIEESYSKVIFVNVKRIQLNQCVVITKHSANVYWLKLLKNDSEKQGDSYRKGINMEINELPGSVFGEMLQLDTTHMTLSMCVLTELGEFNSSLQSFSQEGKKTRNLALNKGSFYIKNEILEDKVIYLTVYTRTPKDVIKKYTNPEHEDEAESHLTLVHNQKAVPPFIITKLEFPVPINDVSSSFVTEVSDKYRNQMAIYKQFGDDENEWEIKLFTFGFDDIEGEQIVEGYLKGLKQHERSQNFSRVLALPNTAYVPKAKIIILPQEFTSSINIQQFIRLDQSEQKASEATYLIVSINQTFAQDQQGQNYQNQIEQPNLPQQNPNQTQNQNIIQIHQQQEPNKPPSYCWTHLCKLTFIQNSDKFTQWIQKSPTYKLQSTSFLKIININYDQNLLYILRLAHQRVNNQLYQNKLDLVNINSGKIVQKGYLSLKNFQFSPNQMIILDTPQKLTTQPDFFFHLRMLFDKKSLYAFMIEHSKKYFSQITDSTMIETILSLL